MHRPPLQAMLFPINSLWAPWGTVLSGCSGAVQLSCELMNSGIGRHHGRVDLTADLEDQTAAMGLQLAVEDLQHEGVIVGDQRLRADGLTCADQQAEGADDLTLSELWTADQSF